MRGFGVRDAGAVSASRGGAPWRATALAVLLTLGALSWPQPGRATEEYAERSQHACAYCHRDPAGGGALTGAGEAFAAAGRQWPIPPEAGSGRLSPAARVFRFVLGFAHLLAAVLWLGTIFYVHLVLKPHYAKGGLPKTEMRIAWGSIAVLALTGVPLTALRFRDPGALLATTAGNLLLVKVGLYLFLVLAAAFVTLVLSPRLKARRAAWQDNDGVEGRPAWVKVGDRLYDVTRSPRWAGGSHFGRHQAGEDLTAALKGAPHGPEPLAGFPSFSLVGGSLRRESAEVRVLFVMAYVNLFVAVAVLFVLALWRWG